MTIEQKFPGYFCTVNDRGQAAVVVGFDELVDWLHCQVAARGPSYTRLQEELQDAKDEIDDLKQAAVEGAKGWDGG